MQRKYLFFVAVLGFSTYKTHTIKLTVGKHTPAALSTFTKVYKYHATYFQNFCLRRTRNSSPSSSHSSQLPPPSSQQPSFAFRLCGCTSWGHFIQTEPHTLQCFVSGFCHGEPHSQGASGLKQGSTLPPSFWLNHSLTRGETP